MKDNMTYEEAKAYNEKNSPCNKECADRCVGCKKGCEKRLFYELFVKIDLEKCKDKKYSANEDAVENKRTRQVRVHKKKISSDTYLKNYRKFSKVGLNS